MGEAAVQDRGSWLAEVGAAAAGRPKLAVLIPTTGDLLVVRGLVDRPRLPRSHAVVAGDFRSLGISADYHQLVSGPLQALRLPPGSVELRLSGDIDCGRSWELPVSLAHAISAEGRLAGDVEAAEIVVWATGALDSELSLVADDYYVVRKIENAMDELRRLVAAGKDVRLLLPASMGAGEAKAIEARLAGLAVSVRRVAGLAEALRELGLAPSAPPQEERPADESAVRPAASGRRPWPIVLAACLGAAAIAFGASILWRDEGSNGTGAGMVRISELHAADRDACIAAIMAGEGLASRPLKSGRDGWDATGHDGMCGLRFTNAGSRTLRLGLDGALQAYTILGGENPLFRGVELDANGRIDLLFSRPALDAETVLSVEDSGRISNVRLRIAGRS